MTRLVTRIARIVRSPRATLSIFVLLVVGTATAVLAPQLARGGGGKTSLATPPDLPVPLVTLDPHGVQLTGILSQPKLVQGSNGVVYLDLTITAPVAALPAVAHRARDIVVVLDRSGSMAADNKLPYAKEAVRSVIEQLHPDDRFALVTFDSSATVTMALAPLTNAIRAQISRQLADMRPGASTNISDGLLKARALLEGSGTERSRRVILLSDGEANMGIVDPRELGKIAASFSAHGAVLSTIGMGLGFNETLMASLADYGMGHYAYLEHLATLGDILQKDLHDAQQVYASASSLDITLGDGVAVTDVGGYPIDLTSQPGTARVVTGQLLSGAKKHFVVTMQVPTSHVGDVRLGAVTLQYTTSSGTSSIALPREHLQIAILETARRDEALASIDKDLYRQIWESNNLGRMQKELSGWLRLGDRKKAQETIASYRDALHKEEAATAIPMSSPEVQQKLSTMEKDLNEAFSGPVEQQAAKRNRSAKEQHKKSFLEQRASE
jgi:Ca-activated chloride channel family protein